LAAVQRGCSARGVSHRGGQGCGGRRWGREVVHALGGACEGASARADKVAALQCNHVTARREFTLRGFKSVRRIQEHAHRCACNAVSKCAMHCQSVQCSVKVCLHVSNYSQQRCRDGVLHMLSHGPHDLSACISHQFDRTT